MEISFCASNALVFIGDCVEIRGKINIGDNCVCYPDSNTSCNGFLINVYESKNIIIGGDCMFSWDIRSGF